MFKGLKSCDVNEIFNENRLYTKNKDRRQTNEDGLCKL